ncbi:MAG: adenosylcobalamin-dependent ribonucleoside-diphosphate reductase [Patescibacteria group bacterium]|jgi:ribonucleoside-diphosphate reductase alpha chain
MSPEDIIPLISDNARLVLESRYLLRDSKGKLIETPAQLFRRVARVIAVEERHYGATAAEARNWENLFYAMMAHGEFLPNTPTLMNAGASLGQLSACYVIPIKDSVDSIFDALKAAAEVHKSGGGTGFDFSEIRPRGDLVRSTGGIASGPVSFLHIFDAVTDVIRQGGKRRGANMGVLRVDHPDILEFIEAKLHDECLRNFNVSVSVTDAFMRAVAAGRNYKLYNPHTGKVAAERPAREIFDKIVAAAWRTGDPGILFIDAINRLNPTRHIGPIASTNPCGEVPLHPWESCNLGSINLSKLVAGEPLSGKFDWLRLKGLVHDAVRFLDDIIDANRFPLEQCAAAARDNRRIGLGIMGFAEALIHLGIPYDSDEALKFADRLMGFIEREGHAASAELARQRGSFPNFRGSLWQKRGAKRMRNATITTIAPTGTISVLAGCSSGIEPLFAVSFVRHVLEGQHLVETTPLFREVAKKRGLWNTELELRVAANGSVQDVEGLSAAEKRIFRTAHEINVAHHVRMQAAFQRHTDNAVSKTINLPETASPAEVRNAYLEAWKLKCKGITVYRDGSKTNQVLTTGAAAGGKKDLVGAGSEYAGGCPAGVCAYMPT